MLDAVLDVAAWVWEAVEPRSWRRARRERERHEALVRCQCGRRAVVALSAPHLRWPLGRCPAHRDVPATWPWLVERLGGAGVGACRPMLAGEVWGEPMACAVPLREEEL